MPGTKARLLTEPRVSTARSGSEDDGMLSETLFTKMLAVERKRTERSNRRFVLMLVDCGQQIEPRRKDDLLPKLVAAVARTLRETDLRGWYRDRAVLGVILTEIGVGDDKTVVQAVSSKIIRGLYDSLSIQEITQLLSMIE